MQVDRQPVIETLLLSFSQSIPGTLPLGVWQSLAVVGLALVSAAD